MSLANKLIDLMEQLAALNVHVTEITINEGTAHQLAADCGFPLSGGGGTFSFNGAKVWVTKPKPTEKQQLIAQLRACADQMEKSE